MIKIVDYGMGNCGSIKNMLRYLGADAQIVSQPEELIDANAIILPGVGAFDHGIKKLSAFKPILEKKILNEKVPFLGICLGMQLLLQRSEEGTLAGLGWIDGEVKRFSFELSESSRKLAVPHMGWNEVWANSKKDNLLDPLISGVYDRFYFVHSFHAQNVPGDNILAYCHYGYDFICAVQKNNIYGVQFHPEKSHKFGKHFLAKFIELVKC